ncbi:MAG: sugar phosphate nucleotidyltransferase [Candidatus Omnitrophota bacterium]
MKANKVFITILAGGRGERFWPKSTKSKPKQVLSFFSNKTLIEESALRVKNIAGANNLYILCNKELKTALKKFKILKNANIIAEPAGRNTAPSIALASALTEKENPGAVMVVLPCDQYIGDNKKFISALNAGIEAARSTDNIVTIGIKPAYPATGYGYINIGKEKSPALFAVQSFKEKPDEKTAGTYFKSGKFLWNAGIFIFKSSVMLSLFEQFSPLIYKDIKAIVDSGNFNKALNSIYPKIEKISIDYCIMEKTKNILCVEGDFKWCDIGSWESLEYIFGKDKNSNIIKAENFAGINIKDCIILSEKNHLVGVIGISGLIVVHTENATLICPKEKAQEVRALVEILKTTKKTEKFL